MPANTTPIFPGSIINSLVKISDNTDTTEHVIFTAGENGARVDSIICYNTDDDPIGVSLFIKDAANTIELGNVTLDSKTKTDLVKELDFELTDNAIYIASTNSLAIKITQTGNGSALDIAVFGGSY